MQLQSFDFSQTFMHSKNFGSASMSSPRVDDSCALSETMSLDNDLDDGSDSESDTGEALHRYLPSRPGMS